MLASSNRRVQALELSIQGLIVYSIVTMALETMPELVAYRALFQLSEFVVVAFRRIAPEFAAFAFVASVVILISAIGLYYAEHDAQPQVYSSIPASLWWAIVTLTTVGYGDAYPTTLVGKIIASVVMLTGIGLNAVPTGLLGKYQGSGLFVGCIAKRVLTPFPFCKLIFCGPYFAGRPRRRPRVISILRTSQKVQHP